VAAPGVEARQPKHHAAAFAVAQAAALMASPYCAMPSGIGPYRANALHRTAVYAPGTVRACRWHGEGDVRGYRPPPGWSARADLSDIHPITGRALPRAVWWIVETKE